jgi:hypothetical protein
MSAAFTKEVKDAAVRSMMAEHRRRMTSDPEYRARQEELSRQYIEAFECPAKP